MYSEWDSKTLLLESFLIRTSSDQCLFDGSPKLIAANYVLHRFLLPGNPPYALHSLIIKSLSGLSSSWETNHVLHAVILNRPNWSSKMRINDTLVKSLSRFDSAFSLNLDLKYFTYNHIADGCLRCIMFLRLRFRFFDDRISQCFFRFSSVFKEQMPLPRSKHVKSQRIYRIINVESHNAAWAM